MRKIQASEKNFIKRYSVSYIGPWTHSVENQIDFNFMINYASTFKPIDRELIYLYLIGESQQDIADVLGLSLTNVSTKLNRLWKRIDEYMNKGAEDVK